MVAVIYIRVSKTLRLCKWRVWFLYYTSWTKVLLRSFMGLYLY